MYSPREVQGKKVWAHWVWCKYAIDFLKQDGQWRIWRFRCFELARAPFEENWVSFGEKNQAAFDLDLMYFGDDGKPVFMPPADEPIADTSHPYSPSTVQQLQPEPPGRTPPSPRSTSRTSDGHPQLPLLRRRRAAARRSGIAVSVQLPWYRSLWLSAVDGVEVSVNGVARAEGPDPLRAGGPLLHVDELPEQSETLWFVADRPDVVAHLDEVPAPGESITVEVVLTMRLLYMQIAPQRYVTNRVPVEREVVLA